MGKEERREEGREGKREGGREEEGVADANPKTRAIITNNCHLFSTETSKCFLGPHHCSLGAPPQKDSAGIIEKTQRQKAEEIATPHQSCLNKSAFDFTDALRAYFEKMDLE